MIGRCCVVQVKSKPIKVFVVGFVDCLDCRESVKWKDPNLGTEPIPEMEDNDACQEQQRKGSSRVG